MSAQNQFGLLRERRFLPFFLTQALGAFNDNVFKNAVVILVAFLSVQLSTAQVNNYVNIAAALFMVAAVAVGSMWPGPKRRRLPVRRWLPA